MSGFGADAPTFNTHEKTRFAPRFLIIVIICWNCVREPCFKELFVKSSLKIRKNFAPNYLFVLSKAFEVPRNFFQKVPWSGFGADAPTFNAHAKKHGVAVLFCFPLPYSERRAMEKSIQTKFCIVTHTEKELCDIIRSCILFLSI